MWASKAGSSTSSTTTAWPCGTRCTLERWDELTRIRFRMRADFNQQVPKQPGLLENAQRAHRFTLVFDREGYSPDFLLRMKKQRIACLTYHKFPGDDWSDEEFRACPVQLHTGEIVSMDLAERGWLVGLRPSGRVSDCVAQRGLAGLQNINSHWRSLAFVNPLWTNNRAYTFDRSQQTGHCWHLHLALRLLPRL